MRYVWAFLLFFPLCAYAAEYAKNLRTVRLTPPTPASMYDNYYLEDDTGQTTYQIKVDGKSRSYHVYAPSEGSSAPRAAVLLLHGAQRTGVSLVEKWKGVADRENLILIGPDGLNQLWSMETEGPDFLDAVMKDARKHYKIDPKRVYLFGHSLGASHALYIAIQRSETFAAVAINAGTFFKPEDAALVKQAKRKIPIAFLIGTDDALFPLNRVESSAEAFAGAGHETLLCILDKHTHWYYDIAHFVNGKAWEFMSRARLG